MRRSRNMQGLRALAGVAGLGLLPGVAAAQACEPVQYTVKANETVFTISETYYGTLEQWSLIFYSNPSKVTNPMQVPEGTVLNIPCPPNGAGFAAGAVETALPAPEPEPEGVEAATPAPAPAVRLSADSTAFEPDATPLQSDNAEMKLVTVSNFAPFTDLEWPGQGMVVELMNAALENAPNPVSYSINWDSRWNEPVPQLQERQFDMGFPVKKPDCTGNPSQNTCVEFHFSDPIVEVLTLVFVKRGSDVKFSADADMIGRRLCRPAGEPLYDLDRADRRWVSDGRVQLERPATAVQCFEMLNAGVVDAVAMNEFTGWKAIVEAGLVGRVLPLETPLGVEGLHVAISKRHWRGTTHLYRVNAGLAALKQHPRYEEIVSRHLGVFWDQVN